MCSRQIDLMFEILIGRCILSRNHNTLRVFLYHLVHAVCLSLLHIGGYHSAAFSFPISTLRCFATCIPLLHHILDRTCCLPSSSAPVLTFSENFHARFCSNSSLSTNVR